MNFLIATFSDAAAVAARDLVFSFSLFFFSDKVNLFSRHFVFDFAEFMKWNK